MLDKQPRDFMDGQKRFQVKLPGTKRGWIVWAESPEEALTDISSRSGIAYDRLLVREYPNPLINR